jgi:hypothetical protein
VKLIANYLTKLKDEDNNIILQFKVSDYNSKIFLEELEKEKNYNLEIKEVKSKRSLQQNALLWKIIGDIAEISKKDIMNIYIQILVLAKAKNDYIKTPNLEVIENLKKSSVFRAIDLVRTENFGNRKEYVVNCFYGSSKMSVKEMNLLIDTAINFAENYGLKYEEEMFYD